jgi:hypothetical protein
MATLVSSVYEPAMRPARERFATNPAGSALASASPDFLESFLIQFCSLGVGLTRPVEGWLLRSGKRCEEVGLPELGRALRSHAKQEAGHDNMMVDDTHALVARWNARRTPHLDAEELLNQPPTRGGLAYQRLHEETIRSDAPYAQIAIEYEIELLPVQFGQMFLDQCQGALGRDILGALSFLREHIVLDVAHSRFNEQQLEKLLQTNLANLDALVRAGTAALDAYAAFLDDCVQIARTRTRELLSA